MNIIFHGAAQEVGKSCIEIQTEGKRYIMDAGIKFSSHGNLYPEFLDRIYELDGVFISHAHLDHSGALPMLEHKRLNCPIYMTKLTWKITNLLLEDSYHLEKLKHMHPAYINRDINAIKHDLRFVNYNQEYTTPDGKIKFTYVNSGHIPGGASIIMQIEGKTLMYTADLNTEDTLLMVKSDAEMYSDIDILITENTYGDRRHPGRKETEDNFIDSINECLSGGGSALVPVFSVGRSQEILLLLSRIPRNIPIYLDGMARKLTKMFTESQDPYIKNKELLQEMYNRVHIINKPQERKEIARKKGIIIVSTSGMVQGGPVVTYAENMIHDKENFIILTGYQAKGTTGRSLFEDHLLYRHGHRFQVKAHVRKYDFSAHYGQDSIHSLITAVKPKNLILQHGDIQALEAVKMFADKNLDGKVYLPRNGEVMKF